jgi:hypothetical protein
VHVHFRWRRLANRLRPRSPIAPASSSPAEREQAAAAGAGAEPRKTQQLKMERPSYVAALSVPLLRNQMVEVAPDKLDSLHLADVLIERCAQPQIHPTLVLTGD